MFKALALAFALSLPLGLTSFDGPAPAEAPQPAVQAGAPSTSAEEESGPLEKKYFPTIGCEIIRLANATPYDQHINLLIDCQDGSGPTTVKQDFWVPRATEDAKGNKVNGFLYIDPHKYSPCFVVGFVYNSRAGQDKQDTVIQIDDCSYVFK